MADESRRPSAGPTSIRNLTHDQIAELVEENTFMGATPKK